jgi:hypothetical protein
MKPPIKLQTPNEDRTEFENFEDLAKKLFSVPKEELDAKRLSDKQSKDDKKRKLKPLNDATK